MNIMNRIRIYHATLATLSIIAFLTGEMEIIHAWLGYGVAIVILFRLLWALSGERQVGLDRFYPSFEGLKVNTLFTHPAVSKGLILGVALSLLGVTFTGIAIDKGKAIGLANTQMIADAYAGDDAHEDGGGNEEEGLMTEIHEVFSNIMLLFVGMHVSYLVLFRRPLAKFMLFLPRQAAKDK